MIEVTCQCGKRLGTADENAGKRMRCPRCGKALIVPKGGGLAQAAEPPKRLAADDPPGLGDLAALAAAAEPEVFQPATPATRAAAAGAASAKLPRSKSNPAVPSAAAGFAPPRKKQDDEHEKGMGLPISLSPGLIVLIVLAIIVPCLIYWVEHGPMEANRQWRQISSIADDNIVGQTTRAIQYEFKTELASEMEGLTYHPKATSMFFDEPPIMWRLPDSIAIQVASTEGNFHGTFHPHTYQFELVGNIRGVTHTITGSASSTDQTLELDGKQINGP